MKLWFRLRPQNWGRTHYADGYWFDGVKWYEAFLRMSAERAELCHRVRELETALELAKKRVAKQAAAKAA